MSFYSGGSIQTYYHYTSADSALKIWNSGVILKSTACNAVCGVGVYLTQQDPSTHTYDIAKNNYDDATYFPQQKIHEGKVDCVVRINMDSAKLVDYSAVLGRDVHLYPMKDLDLNGNDVERYRIYRRN